MRLLYFSLAANSVWLRVDALSQMPIGGAFVVMYFELRHACMRRETRCVVLSPPSFKVSLSLLGPKCATLSFSCVILDKHNVCANSPALTNEQTINQIKHVPPRPAWPVSAAREEDLSRKHKGKDETK